MINIGKYIEIAINWLTENFAPFFDAVNVGIGGFIEGFQNVLMWIPFYVTIALLTLLAWYKSGKGVGVFTALGLLLIRAIMVDDSTRANVCIVSFQNPIPQMSNKPKAVNTPTPFPDLYQARRVSRAIVT